MSIMQRNSFREPRRSRALMVMTILTILILIVFIISMNTGVIRLGPLEVLRTFFGGGTAKQSLILFDFRLPRIVISILVGMGLAISGAILQGISRNALADPGILGINAGAGFVVLLYVIYFPLTAAAAIFLLPVLAFVGAGLTAALIYSLAFKRHEGLAPIRLLLTGIAIAAGISAFTIVLTKRLDPNKFQFVQTWMVG